MEKDIGQRKEDAVAADEELERCRSQLDTLKLALEAKEKVLKRMEEKSEADAQEWKEKEACFEAQLLEMSDLREKVDQLSTVEYNPYRSSSLSSKQSRMDKTIREETCCITDNEDDDDDNGGGCNNLSRVDSDAFSYRGRIDGFKEKAREGKSVHIIEEKDKEAEGISPSIMETDDHSTEVRHLTNRSLLFHQSRWGNDNGLRLPSFLQETKVEPVEPNSSPIQIQDE